MGDEFRIAYCVSRIALGELALFGFVFLRWAGRNIYVSPCGIIGCGDFRFSQIGFVLHNRGHDSLANWGK